MIDIIKFAQQNQGAPVDLVQAMNKKVSDKDFVDYCHKSLRRSWWRMVCGVALGILLALYGISGIVLAIMRWTQ